MPESKGQIIVIDDDDANRRGTDMALRKDGYAVAAFATGGEGLEHLRAHGADLLIAECYFYRKPVRFHLNYPDIQAHRGQLRAKRLVLTHLGREMLEHKAEVAEECAYDGLRIEL